MRLIDADKMYISELEECLFRKDDPQTWIDAQQTVDVSMVVHAKWEVVPGFDWDDPEIMTIVACSNCKNEISLHYGYAPKYCPECGAKMDLEDLNDVS